MLTKFLKDPFFKVLGFNGISVVLKIVMGLVSTKLVAIFLGLQGINTLEYFRNFTSASDSLLQLGTQNGIIKFSASSDSTEQDKKVVSTTFFMLMASCFLFLILALFNLGFVQQIIFGNNNFQGLLLLYLFSAPLVVLQFILVNYLQGKQHFKKVILLNSLGYIINIGLSIYLIINHQLAGAILQIIIAPIILSFITLFVFQKKLDILQFVSYKSIDRNLAKDLLHFSLMNLISGVLTPLSFIFIRNLVQQNLNLETAGIWSAILRISGFYMVFVASLCSLYFFPKLAKCETNTERKLIVNEYYKKFVPLIFLGLLLCFLLQTAVILSLYTRDFLIIKKYFYLQLIADFVKSSALVYGLIIVAKQNTKLYILLEILSVGSYCLGSFFLINIFQLNGVYYALIGSLLIYFILAKSLS